MSTAGPICLRERSRFLQMACQLSPDKKDTKDLQRMLKAPRNRVGLGSKPKKQHRGSFWGPKWPPIAIALLCTLPWTLAGNQGFDLQMGVSFFEALCGVGGAPKPGSSATQIAGAPTCRATATSLVVSPAAENQGVAPGSAVTCRLSKGNTKTGP